MKIVIDGKTAEVPVGASQEAYSTEETRIGTWIDGKPLYRTSYSVNTGLSVNYPVQAISENFYVVRIYGFLVDGSGSFVPIPGRYKDYQIGVYVNSGYIYTNADTFYQNYPAVITIEYTKTTDTDTKAVAAPVAAMTYEIPKYDTAMASDASASIEVDVPAEKEV